MTEEALAGWGLLSFPPSTGCALARWAMLLYGLEFTEEWHTVPFLQLKSKKLGAPDQFFPVIYKGDQVFSSSKTGLGYLETIVPSDRKLVPTDPEQAKLVNELWTDIFDTLGGQAGPWAYSYLLPMRSIMVPVFGDRCPWYEKAFVALLYSTVRGMVGGALGIGDDTAAVAMQAIEQMFARVDDLLTDGREFLVGDRLTMADMSFACLGVPLVWADGFDGALPPLDRAPAELQETVAAFRKRPAGQFILKMFDVYRPTLSREKAE